MRKIYYAAHTYMIVGLLSGLFYREFTVINDFTGETRLSIVHTHLLALGMLFHLILLVLEKSFRLTVSRLFDWSFWVYNTGLTLTVGIMIVQGVQQVRGVETPEAVSGLAGLGHIILTVGLVLFFINLGKRVAECAGAQDSPTEPAIDRVVV